MKHIRLTALALSGALTLSLLTACGGDKPAETPDVTETPEVIESQLPETETPEVPESEAPAETEAPSEKPAETAKPSEKPVETPKPSEKPAETSAPEVPSEAPAETSKVQAAWDAIVALGELPGFGDLDADMLDALYGISADDLDEYIAKVPMISVQATEFFIAKVKSGKMDTVKEGIAKRQADLVAQWQQYLPAQLELVENYKLVTNGDYIMFAIAEQADAAVTAFNDCTK